MKNVGIIPARGGSKSITKKNMQLLGGKPLIEYTIETAIKSKVFDIIAITTDCNDILEISRKFKNVFLIKRPDEISTDTSSTVDCVMHACDVIKSEKKIIPDFVITLEPTSPFRSVTVIEKCINIL